MTDNEDSLQNELNKFESLIGRNGLEQTDSKMSDNETDSSSSQTSDNKSIDENLMHQDKQTNVSTGNSTLATVENQVNQTSEKDLNLRKESSSHRKRRSRSRSRSRSKHKSSSSSRRHSSHRHHRTHHSTSAKHRRSSRDRSRDRDRHRSHKHHSSHHKHSSHRKYHTSRSPAHHRKHRSKSTDRPIQQAKQEIGSNPLPHPHPLPPSFAATVLNESVDEVKNLSITDLLKEIELPKHIRPHTQEALNYQAEQLRLKTEEKTGVKVPTYYNASSINPLAYAEQQRKRKLLWSKAKDNDNTTTNIVGKAIVDGQDERTALKFRKLMGIKNEEDVQNSSKSVEDISKMQQNAFEALDKEYAFARMATHTHRGMGLGFLSHAHVQQPSQKH